MGAPAEATVRRRGRPRDERAGAVILDAALAEVAEHGWGRTTIDSVAARAGVSKATIYRRWPSKERLVLDAMLHVSDAVFEDVDSGSLRGDLVEILDRVAAVLTTRPGCDLIPQLLAAARVDPELRTIHDRATAERRRAVQWAFDRAVARGELDGAIDVDGLIDLLAGPVFFRSLFGAEPPGHGFVEVTVDAVLAAVAAGALRRKAI